MADLEPNRHEQDDGQSYTVVPVRAEVLQADDCPTSNKPTKPKCSARKTDGSPCPNYPVHGSTVCAAHGAFGGRPVSTAKHTKYLPSRLRERYEELVNNPNYVSLREQIGAIELRLQELFSRMTRGDSSQRRRDILEEMDKLVEDLNAGLLHPDLILDLENEELPHEVKERRVSQVIQGATELRRRILAIQDQARAERREDEVWEDVDRFSESLRKLKETEVKRMVAANQVLTVTESYNLIQRLVQFIEDWLNPEALRKAISENTIDSLRAKAVRELYQLLERRGGK